MANARSAVSGKWGAGYLIYVAISILLVLSTVLPPFLAQAGIGAAQMMYAADSTACHQLVRRSFCIYQNGSGLSIRDCINGGNETLTGPDAFSGRPHMVFSDYGTGYAFGQCARNTSIYLFMLVGALLYPLYRKTISTHVPHPAWLLLALVPMGVDGTTQLLAGMNPNWYWLSFMGLHESTNLLRVLTGGIAGFAISFYAIPLLNSALGMFIRPEKEMEPGPRTERQA